MRIAWKILLAKTARECFVAELMEDVGLDYDEADEIVKEIENQDALADLLYQTMKAFFCKEYEKKEADL